MRPQSFLKTALIGLSFTVAGCAEQTINHNEVPISSSSAAISSSNVASSAISSMSSVQAIAFQLTYRNSAYGFSVEYPKGIFVLRKNQRPISMNGNFPQAYWHLDGDSIGHVLPYRNCYKGPDQCEDTTINVAITFFVLPEPFGGVQKYYGKQAVDTFQTDGRSGFSTYSGGEGTNVTDRFLPLNATHTLWIQTQYNADELQGLDPAKSYKNFLSLKDQEKFDQQIFATLSFK